MRRQARLEKSLTLPKEVHEIRVLAKKLRAYLQLFRGTFPERCVSLEEKRIKQIARNLSRARDEDICRQVLRWLAAKENKESRRKWLQATLVPFPEPAATDLDKRMLAQARKGIEARRLRLLALIGKHSAKEGKLEELLQKEYGKSRRAMGEAVHEGSPEAFHQWRKRVKRLGYQIEVFCTPSRKGLARLERKFLRLGRLLGKLQDLHVLKGWIESQANSPARKLVPLLDGWMARYRKEAEREGRRCFRMSKGKFLSLLE
ncbi:CHAD domain-containing protein [Verrucomicrobium sp. 3C]|uniref:CHAD domain-containing protein n=1 Tax=Verrucomicrobium sp. 3C TaxID=1134055 RepID=UPI0018CB2C58|nr:CHAD domain-containing protein [Verrucomicrobium sp. 3C]